MNTSIPQKQTQQQQNLQEKFSQSWKQTTLQGGYCLDRQM